MRYITVGCLLFVLIYVMSFALHIPDIHAIEMKSSQYKLNIETVPSSSNVSVKEKVTKEVANFRKKGYTISSTAEPIVLNISDSNIELKKNGSTLSGSLNLTTNMSSSPNSIYIEQIDTKDAENILRLSINKRDIFLPAYIDGYSHTVTLSSPDVKNYQAWSSTIMVSVSSIH